MFVELKLGVACAQSYSRRGSQTRCRNKRVPIVNDYPVLWCSKEIMILWLQCIQDIPELRRFAL